MTKPTHTPGPWILDENGRDVRTCEAFWPAGRVRGQKIAYVAHTEDVMGEANASLIAAAPDLLAACERIRSALYGRGNVSGADLNALTDAIKKARGGA